MTYNTQNLVGAGCYEARGSGLTGFRREVIDELNRLRMLINLSHVGPVTSEEAIAHSRLPVCYFHVRQQLTLLTCLTPDIRLSAHQGRSRHEAAHLGADLRSTGDYLTQAVHRWEAV